MRVDPIELPLGAQIDATRITVWGDGNARTFTLADAHVLTSVSVTRDYPVYGRLFPAQNVRVGSYADSITVTVNH